MFPWNTHPLTHMSSQDVHPPPQTHVHPPPHTHVLTGRPPTPSHMSSQDVHPPPHTCPHRTSTHPLTHVLTGRPPTPSHTCPHRTSTHPLTHVLTGRPPTPSHMYSQDVHPPPHTCTQRTSTHPLTHLWYHHKHQHQHSHEEVQCTQPSQEGEEGGHTGSKPSFNRLYESIADGQPIPDISSSLLSPSVELVREQEVQPLPLPPKG